MEIFSIVGIMMGCEDNKMIQTRKLAMISEEEIIGLKFNLKKLYEEHTLHDLKLYGHKFIKWIWVFEIIPENHQALFVTYEVKEK